jgi:protein-L-isoaspartate(D-aspartate) O-methyltransferase
VNALQFEAPRRRMIEAIQARGIRDLDILDRFDRIPRHLFLPEALWKRAYEDAPLPIGFGQTASQPSLQAHILRLLEVTAEDHVLEIGTGSGFFTALLADAAARVFSVERIRELSHRARAALDRLAIRNAALWVGDGSIGWRKYAPFQVITVAAASPSVPGALADQLAPGGRLLIPVGTLEEQELVRVRKVGDGPGGFREERGLARCTFVPLVGLQGWSDPSTDLGGRA